MTRTEGDRVRETKTAVDEVGAAIVTDIEVAAIAIEIETGTEIGTETEEIDIATEVAERGIDRAAEITGNLIGEKTEDLEARARGKRRRR